MFLLRGSFGTDFELISDCFRVLLGGLGLVLGALGLLLGARLGAKYTYLRRV